MFPQTSEQGAVAKRVEEVGAGKMLTSADEKILMDTIETVLSDLEYKRNAKKISDGFKKCGGAKAAKEYLEKL